MFRKSCIKDFCVSLVHHDDVIKWKHFPRLWPLCGEFTGDRWILRTKASDSELWCFLWSAPNIWLSKQWWGWWFEMPSCPLWCHCNVLVCTHNLQGYFTDTCNDFLSTMGVTLEDMGKTTEYQATLKYNKIQTMYIILGIYSTPVT